MIDRPTLGRIVLYRSKVGLYVVPAVVTATIDTLHPSGIERYEQTNGREGVPPLDDELHVHLTVMSPGICVDKAPPPGMDANRGGTFREWNIGPSVTTLEGSPLALSPVNAGDAPENAVAMAPGTWAWPPRFTSEQLRGV